MTPKEMLSKPISKRRGAVTQETGAWAHLLIDAPPDKILDQLLKDKVIGAALRDCHEDVVAKRVPAPQGDWGMLARLKGHSWTYVLAAASLRREWPQQWAARYGWRIAWFSLEDVLASTARLYDGKRELFNFVYSHAAEPKEGLIFRKAIDGTPVTIRGEARVCTRAWLDRLKNGGEALDLLAREADAYLPVWLRQGNEDDQATISGWDGNPHPEWEDQIKYFPDDAFERVDLFAFGGPDSLKPKPATKALFKAVEAGNVKAAQKAIAAGADPNARLDGHNLFGVVLSFAQGGMVESPYEQCSPRDALKLMEILFKAGATPPENHMHWALRVAKNGDERTIFNQIQLLLDYKADPNSLQHEHVLSRNRVPPLRVAISSGRWLGVIKLLVARGADVNLKSEDGLTPRQFALEQIRETEQQIAALGLPPKAAESTASEPASGSKTRKKPVRSPFPILLDLGGSVFYEMIEQLNAVVAFLSEAEKGKADLSDIDAIVDASSKKYAEAERKKQEEIARWSGRPAKGKSKPKRKK